MLGGGALFCSLFVGSRCLDRGIEGIPVRDSDSGRVFAVGGVHVRVGVYVGVFVG